MISKYENSLHFLGSDRQPRASEEECLREGHGRTVLEGGPGLVSRVTPHAVCCLSLLCFRCLCQVTVSSTVSLCAEEMQEPLHQDTSIGNTCKGTLFLVDLVVDGQLDVQLT